MSTSALCDVVARLTTEPALAAELDADPDAFGRQHRLTVDEVATLRALRRPRGGRRRPGAIAGAAVQVRDGLRRHARGAGAGRRRGRDRAGGALRYQATLRRRSLTGTFTCRILVNPSSLNP